MRDDESGSTSWWLGRLEAVGPPFLKDKARFLHEISIKPEGCDCMSLCSLDLSDVFMFLGYTREEVTSGCC